MSNTEILRHEVTFERLKQEDERGEYWSARDLMPYADYADWRNWNDAINKAMTAFRGLGEDTRGHFSVLAPKSTGGRPRADFRLSRRACYLVFMNGDPSKPAIAAAQNYFAVKTRQAEVMEQQAPAKMPTLQEALRGWADEVDAREKAELAAREAEMEAALLRPPAEAWENLVDTGQDYDVATAASILNRDPAISTGRNRLFQWMLDSGMLYRRAGGQLVPYAAHTEHLRLKPQSRPDYEASDSRARKEAHAQVRVTVRGLEWIQQRMREETRPDLTEIAPLRNVISISSAR